VRGPIDYRCLIRFAAFNIGELIFFENEETVFATPLARASLAAVYFLRLRAIALALRGPPAISQIVALSAVRDRRCSACAGAR